MLIACAIGVRCQNSSRADEENRPVVFFIIFIFFLPIISYQDLLLVKLADQVKI